MSAAGQQVESGSGAGEESRVDMELIPVQEYEDYQRLKADPTAISSGTAAAARQGQRSAPGLPKKLPLDFGTQGTPLGGLISAGRDHPGEEAGA